MNSGNNPLKRKADQISSSKEEDFFGIKPPLQKTKLTTPETDNKVTQKSTTKTNTPWYKNQQLLTKFIPMKPTHVTGTGKISTNSLLICHWNVDGFKRVVMSGHLQQYFKTRKPDILCLNETKIDPKILESEKLISWIPSEYNYYFNPSQMKKHYAGVAIITRFKPLSVKYGLGDPKHDLEGRVLTLEFETFYLVSVYVPFSGEGFKRLPYRFSEWDPALREFLVKLKANKHVIACGDFNVAHQSLDMWEESGQYIGSTPTERNSFGKLLNAGFLDTFRYKHPNVRKYSWWNISKGNRVKNLGRRFDYFVADEGSANGIIDAFVNNDIHGSDHCPVELLYNPNFEDGGVIVPEFGGRVVEVGNKIQPTNENKIQSTDKKEIELIEPIIID